MISLFVFGSCHLFARTSSINKLFRLRWGFIPATVSHLLSLPLSLSLSPFSRFLAHSNDCHGNHQRCQTTNKRKSFNIHLSQKEQNCSLITMGTIKTVHIYWQGTSHRSICSWIHKKKAEWGGGVGSECLDDGVAMKKKNILTLESMWGNFFINWANMLSFYAMFDVTPYCKQSGVFPLSQTKKKNLSVLIVTRCNINLLFFLFLPLPLTATVSLSMLQEQGIPIWALLSILITHLSPPVIQVYFKIHNYIWKE